MGGSIWLDSCADLDGSVITQLYALLEVEKEQGVPESYVHFFGDTAPTSAAGYASDLLSFMEKLPYGQLATVVRTARWSMMSAWSASRSQWMGGDGVKEIEVNSEKGDRRVPEADYAQWRHGHHYHPALQRRISFPCGVPSQHITNVLVERLSKEDMKQAHFAAPLRRNREIPARHLPIKKQFPGEERFMIPSLKVSRLPLSSPSLVLFPSLLSLVRSLPNYRSSLNPQVMTHDPQPEMSIQGVADKVASIVESGEYGFVMYNFAPQDMVGVFLFFRYFPFCVRGGGVRSVCCGPADRVCCARLECPPTD
ncbi:hypothetical protein B0H19DRAFT_593115 [Mycena capillaripes]|nr:hypothetical protein B0H19DRAFT_593115 [Mycena capillaripes]